MRVLEGKLVDNGTRVGIVAARLSLLLDVSIFPYELFIYDIFANLRKLRNITNFS